MAPHDSDTESDCDEPTISCAILPKYNNDEVPPMPVALSPRLSVSDALCAIREAGTSPVHSVSNISLFHLFLCLLFARMTLNIEGPRI